MSNIDSMAQSAFGGGAELALVACTMSAAIVMLGVAVHRAVGNP